MVRVDTITFNLEQTTVVSTTVAVTTCSHPNAVAVAEVPATCTEAGVGAHWSCPNCERLFSDSSCQTEVTLEGLAIAALGHDWGEGEVTTEPTCTKPGVRTYACSRCDETKTEEIAALGHDWGAWVVTKEATEDADGSETRTCARCGETETRAIPRLGVEYRSTEGDESSWTRGSGAGLTFTFKRSVDDDRTFGAYRGARVDGAEVPGSAVTTAKGSLVLTLSASYLETLSAGTHTLAVSFADGEASASFAVAAAPSSGGASSGTKSSAASSSGTAATARAASAPGLPRTGDASLVLPAAALAASGAAALLAARRAGRSRR